MEQKSDSPRLTHWRRHANETGAEPVEATACGRVVFDYEVKDDPTEADCPECASIASWLAADAHDKAQGGEF